MAKSTGQERGSAAVTVGILVLTALAIAVILIMGRPRQTKVALTTPHPTRTPQPTATPSPMTVYVSGAVARPGSYTLPPNSRVEAAIAAAGGALDTADLSRVNLADTLRDGAQIDVPILTQTAAPTATPIGGVKVNVNTATADELDDLPGIGPSLAQRIVEYRTANGPFASADALDDVSGIGPALIDGLRDLVRFD